MSRLLRIGELASQAGVSTRTVDFYTGLGLIGPAERTAGNFRLYTPDCVERIAAIRALEANGVSLSDMAAALQRGTEDLTGQLSRLQGDLDLLREAAAHAGPAANQLLHALTARLQSLISTAIEVTSTLPPI